MKKIGFAMCGSFCTLERAVETLEIIAGQYDVLPVMSKNAYETDTRFGKAESFIKRAEEICGKKVLHTIAGAEPIGPKRLVDLMLVAPCTGNTASKIALGITDTPVTMAVKSSLRIGLPVVICLASNDALGASGVNISRLMNTKNVYFVPMRQDDPEKKPFSLVADFSRIPQTLEEALEGRQLQPVFA